MTKQHKAISAEFQSRRNYCGRNEATHTETMTTVNDLIDWATTRAMIDVAHNCGDGTWSGWLLLSRSEMSEIVKAARK